MSPGCILVAMFSQHRRPLGPDKCTVCHDMKVSRTRNRSLDTGFSVATKDPDDFPGYIPIPDTVGHDLELGPVLTL